MIELRHVTLNKKDTHGKPRVYFTCHPEDFDRSFYGDELSCFKRICKDILSFERTDCVIYYTSNMSEPLSEETKDALGSMQLLVVPVTRRLLTEQSRAMDVDIAYAKEHGISILPFMMEPELGKLYELPKNFGSIQYLNPYSVDTTEINYINKLAKRLNELFVDKELVEKIRRAFDSYIFLSYRKMDRKLACELMKRIHDIDGYRDIAIWYDEYLVPGESWSDNIDSAMKMVQEKSNLFAMLVTPNLLKMVVEDGVERKNYVMEHEYPDAKEAHMRILPAEMENTDYTKLENEFPEIPHCVDVYGEAFVSAMLDALETIGNKNNDNDPEHLYYIGLAYLNGIDVEIDRERAIELLVKSAESGYVQAMETLYLIYINQHNDEAREGAVYWANRLASHYREKHGLTDGRYVKALFKLANAYHSCAMYSEAFAEQKKAYDLYKDSISEDDEDLLYLLNGLAFRYAAIGDYSRALEIFNDAYNRRLRFYGDPKHPAVLDSMYGLGSAYHDCGKYRDAVRVKNDLYGIYKDIYHESHRTTLRSRWNLAISLIACADQGDKKALGIALDHLLEAVRIYDENEMELDPDALLAKEGLADAYMRLRRRQEAFDIYRKVFMVRRMYYDPKEIQPDTLRVKEKAEDLLDTCGKAEEDVLTCDEKYSSCCEEFGPSSPEAIKAGLDFVKALLKKGNTSDALFLIKDLRSAARHRLKEDDETLRELNRLYGKMKKLYK